MSMASKGKKWLDFDPRRKHCVVIALAILATLIITLVSLPIVHLGTHQGYAWGWISQPGSPPVANEYWFTESIVVMIFSFINLFVCSIVLVMLSIARKNQAIKILLFSTFWTWVWGTCLAIIKENVENVTADVILGVSFAGGIALTVTFIISRPSSVELRDLADILLQIKQNTAVRFQQDGLKPVLDAIIDYANHADELGAWKMAISARTYRRILPKLWHTYIALSRTGSVILKDFKTALGMVDADFSQYMLGLANKLGLVIDGECLVLRKGIDVKQLVDVAERLLLDWLKTADLRGTYDPDVGVSTTVMEGLQT
jgi:hypothetical protein